jgi:hypothetical protein
MSVEAVAQVLERASTDQAWRERAVADPEGALAEYDLTSAEREALMSGEPERLQALGVDERLTKGVRIIH